ncbi:S1C family serine protease [Chloroflexota bacterium]
MKRRYILLLAILLAFLLTLAGCTSNSPSDMLVTPSTPSASTEVVSATPSITSLADIEVTLEYIYTQVNPSVVNISVLQKQETMLPTLPQIPNFPFSGPEGPQQQYSQALGSGFVWDKSGHIVTNNHVVANADNISITFYDGTIVLGKVVGTDLNSDLAVVKVAMPTTQLKPVQMADSTQLKVGQLAIAIGNPFGLQGTMTVGFVSGLGRLLPANENAVGPNYSIPDIIQTDAAINPGNSGGVLLDDKGKVIGVTSSIATTSGTSVGVGFAIPSAIVQQVVPALILTGHYDHPYLGVSIISLNPDLASAMNLPTNQRGALIEAITTGSPADKAGLQASQKQVTINGQQIPVGGDVIVAYNGQVVKSSDDLVTFLARSGSIGQTVSLTVLRSGKQVQVQIALGVRPTS